MRIRKTFVAADRKQILRGRVFRALAQDDSVARHQ
jgi:hypothetical protein